MQDTRLIQLDTAIQMELWQEAYRSAEDVHGMMQLSKDKDERMVKPASYVNYYDKGDRTHPISYRQKGRRIKFPRLCVEPTKKENIGHISGF
ncbi:hypothetical protein LOAG_12797 [Loa loa]|uniref:eIF3a PCI domain-containing protein n=1 Tax=Loa loa TaxID=7209 RepID=A0A1S0TKI4_LOALO|nr:hypothetical protein LOAG_12797 [Loa loa]EFO15714.1 hypothetical protein LOAG_12797 [Loa loa]